MTELKTLKDFERVDCYCRESVGEETTRELIDIEYLKSEAIKWVKKKGYIDWNHTDYVQISVDDWLKFFNLTEEDLK